jgi:hypothetical protein
MNRAFTTMAPIQSLLVKRLSDRARIPTRGSSHAAGYDLYWYVSLLVISTKSYGSNLHHDNNCSLLALPILLFLLKERPLSPLISLLLYLQVVMDASHRVLAWLSNIILILELVSSMRITVVPLV